MCSEVYVARFQSYEFSLSETFETFFTGHNILPGRIDFTALMKPRRSKHKAPTALSAVVLLPIVRSISDKVDKSSCVGILSRRLRLGRCTLACPSTIHGRSGLLTRAKIEI